MSRIILSIVHLRLRNEANVRLYHCSIDKTIDGADDNGDDDDDGNVNNGHDGNSHDGNSYDGNSHVGRTCDILITMMMSH